MRVRPVCVHGSSHKSTVFVLPDVQYFFDSVQMCDPFHICIEWINYTGWNLRMTALTTP